VPDEPSGTDRALELLVFGPIGLAAYLRDTAPSFLRLFVSRGRAILDEQRKSVEGQLGNARVVGEFASVQGAPHVRRVLAEALATVRARTEEAIELLAGLSGSPAPPAPPSAAGAPSSPPASFSTVSTPERPQLAIRDYDELSASQVVERLEGLPNADLDAIRAYEIGHRARNTVLGKIEQLQRPVG